MMVHRCATAFWKADHWLQLVQLGWMEHRREENVESTSLSSTKITGSKRKMAESKRSRKVVSIREKNPNETWAKNKMIRHAQIKS